MLIEKKMRKMFYAALMLMVCFVFACVPLKVDAAAKWKQQGLSYTNGKLTYSVKGDYLCRKNLATGITTKLKKVPMFKDDGQNSNGIVSFVYGNCVYISVETTFVRKAYCYNVKTKQLKKMSNSLQFLDGGSENYFFATPDVTTGISLYSIELYKATTNGYKKIKKLCKYGFGEKIINNKVYYATYPNGRGGELIMKCCNLNGSNVKKLFHIKYNKKDGGILPIRMTSSTIQVYTRTCYYYTYNIKTRKLTKKNRY